MNTNADTAHLLTTLHTLKGAPLSCLVALVALARPAGVQELTILADYSHQMVERGLAKLATLGLAQRHAYRGAWLATRRAAQLPLWNPLDENQQVAGRSSSIYKEVDSIKTTTAPLDEIQQVPVQLSTEKPQLSTAYQQLLALGCPGETASRALNRALARGDTAQAIADRIATGRSHAASPAGRSLYSPGEWLAACIADGRAIPTPTAPADPDPYAGYLPFTDNTHEENT